MEFRNSMKWTRLFVCLVTLIIGAGMANASSYWVSLGSDGDGIRLMQINDLGQITAAPKVVISTASLSNGEVLTAISEGESGKLNLWYEVFAVSPNHLVYRAVVNKNTLTATSAKFGVIAAGEGVLQASQGSTKFIIFESSEGLLKAFGVTSAGVSDGTRWRISPRTNFGSTHGGVSADGRMAWADNTVSTGCPFCANKVYVQPLKTNGRASGDPKVVASGETTFSADISNPLSNGQRYLAYLDIVEHSISLQRIHAATAEKMGTRTFLASSDVGNFSNNVAIDPNGHFVLFANSDPGCGGNDILILHALHATRNPSGTAKKLVPCNTVNGDIIGIDLLLQ